MSDREIIELHNGCLRNVSQSQRKASRVLMTEKGILDPMKEGAVVTRGGMKRDIAIARVTPSTTISS